MRGSRYLKGMENTIMDTGIEVHLIICNETGGITPQQLKDFRGRLNEFISSFGWTCDGLTHLIDLNE